MRRVIFKNKDEISYKNWFVSYSTPLCIGKIFAEFNISSGYIEFEEITISSIEDIKSLYYIG